MFCGWPVRWQIESIQIFQYLRCMIWQMKSRFNRGVVTLIALALTLLTLAHQPLAGPQVDLSAYAMADGTLPALCLDQTDGTAKTHAPCPACTLIAGMHAAAVFALPDVILQTTNADWPAPTLIIRTDNTPRAPPARGPPAPLFI